MPRFFSTGSATAYSDYVNALTDALRNRDWVYDPSFALDSDGEVYQKVLRDPVAAHSIRFRKHLVAGPEWRIEPASDSDQDKAAAEIVGELVSKIRGFTDARICLSEAIFRGSAYAFMAGQRRFASVASGQPMSWWVPERLIDVDRRRFRLIRDPVLGQLVWQLWSVDRRAWEPLANPQWFVRSVFENTEDSLGYGRGMLDTLYFTQASKARLLQDGLMAAERFGQGFATIAIENLRGPDGKPAAGPDRSGTTVAQEWVREFAKHRSRHVMAHDKRDEVQVHTGLGEGWALVERLLVYLDNVQVTAVLGSTLPTIEGDGGSRAMATVQENSTEALVQADRSRLGDDLTRDLIGLIWSLNALQIEAQVGPGAAMPSLRIDQRKLEDPQVNAGVVSTLTQAGVPLVAAEVYEKTGFTQPLPGDELIGSLAPEDLSGLLEDAAPREPATEPQPATELQEQAMNGAQVQALAGLIQSVSAGELPAASAVDLIVVAFPTVGEERARRMVEAADRLEPPQPVEKPATIELKARNGRGTTSQTRTTRA